MRSPEELIESLSKEELDSFAKMGFRKTTLLQIVKGNRDHCHVQYLTEANEKFLINRNVLESIRQRMNIAVVNRKNTKKAIKTAVRELANGKLTDKERQDKQTIATEGKTLLEKIDRQVAQMEADMARIQQEMSKLEKEAVETLKNIDGLMVMSICMMHSLDLCLDEYNDEMRKVGYASTKMPSLLKQFSSVFGEIQQELIATHFYVKCEGKDVWGSKAQTSLHWLTADQLEEFKKQFMLFAAKVLSVA